MKRTEALNNQHLTDGTVIELSRIQSDHDTNEPFEGNPATIDYEVHEIEGDQQYVYHHLQPDESNVARQLLSLLDEHRLVIVYLLWLDRETGVSVTLMGTTDTVQEALDRLPSEIQRYITIDQVTESLPEFGGLRSLLTERHSKEVADAVDIASSTASERRRKIEARMLSSLVLLLGRCQHRRVPPALSYHQFSGGQ